MSANHRVAADTSATVAGGRYLIGSVLGRGGMAEVRRGRDLKLQRPVALKILRADLATDPALRARFEGEARSAARLRHPHVVSIFDIGEERGVPFIVMELLPGDTLADRISAGPLAELTVWPLASQVLGALHAAHSVGILHRDVKPANILFDDEGAAKVADFGIAKSMEGGVAVTLTSAGDVLGTPAYIPPERAEGRAASPASDLWSLGVVLYEALTQERPFPGDNALATALAARQGLITPLSSLRPDLSPGLVAVVERAVAPEPADRFPSAAAMAAALGVGLAGGGPSGPIDEGPPNRAEETGRLIAWTSPLSLGAATAVPSTRRLAAEPSTREPGRIDRNRPALRRSRRSRSGRRRWPALGVAAGLFVAAAVAANVLLGGSVGSGTPDAGSAGQTRTGYTLPVASTPTTVPPTTSAPPPTTSAPPLTPPTTTPTTAPAPSATAPPTTAPSSSRTTTTTTPAPSTTAPPTTDRPPTTTPTTARTPVL